MYKFVETRGVDLVDRKRKSTACAACRRKKKRCKHSAGAEHLPSQASPSSDIVYSTSVSSRLILSRPVDKKQPQPALDVSQRSPPGSETIIANSGVSKVAADVRGLGREGTNHQNTRPADSRFVGDMNPEGVFLAATSPQDLRGGPVEDGIGVWLAQKPNAPESLPELSRTVPPSSLFYGYTSSIQQLLPILERDCLSTIPPKPQREALYTIYLEAFHPVLPIVDKSGFESMPHQSPSRIMLEQGICLVACLNSSSKPHLVLSISEEQLPVKDFGLRLLAAMKVAIEIGIITDKVVLIQALALMSFWVEGREGSESSSFQVGRAVQCAQSLGLHIREREDEPSGSYKETLFCCIWAIDRLNAAFQGRAVLMHERDIERSMQRTIETQAPAFKLLLQVVTLLDRVIGLYRPGNTEYELSEDFELFEDLILKCDASQAPTRLLATIEVLYHAVAVLSCRSRPSEPGSFGPTASRTRQALSTERVTAMLDHEFRDQLVLFPFVPYAISLSLSVNYRNMRRSRLPMSRARAKIAFEANCRILKRLGETFWSAAVMSEMGSLTLKELDRVYSQVADVDSRRNDEFAQAKDSSSQTLTPFDRSAETSTQNSSAMLNANAFYLENMPDLDPFEMFDPSFNLDDVDACLEGNLDLAVPMNLW